MTPGDQARELADMRQRVWTGIALACLFALVSGAVSAHLVRRDARMFTQAALPVSGEALVGSDSIAGDWPMYGRTYGNTRYSPLAEFTPASLAHARVAWQRALPGMEQGPQHVKEESTPLAIDGVLYVSGSGNRVWAVDAKTGIVLWRYQHRMVSWPPLCCGTPNRGVAVYRDKVFLATLDARLIALDKRTGKKVWEREIGDPGLGYSETMAPLVAGGRVIIGVSGAEFGIRGFVDAYDAETGERLWRFWTVPSPAEGGWWGSWTATTPDGDSLPRDLAREHADSAQFADSWRRGGGSVWATPAYDPSTGSLFVGISNPSPTVDDRQRPGDNLYTCSLVALDVATGRLRWHYQMVPHDMWDTDAGSPIVLFPVAQGDSVIPALAHASKDGWVYILDRRSGRLLYRSEPFVPQKNMFHRPELHGDVGYPVAHGGNPWAPPAWSPHTGLLYVLGKHSPTWFRVEPDSYETGENSVGGELANAHKLKGLHEWGTLTAIDPRTGRIAWQDTTSSPLSYSGALVTAGGLLFFGDKHGLHTLDASTGELLRAFPLNARVTGPPISYMAGGRQYLAVMTLNGLAALELAPEPRSFAELSREALREW